MSHRGKEGEDAEQKTNHMEIKRHTGERQTEGPDIVKELNEVIISKDLILQALHSWVGQGKQERERKDIYYQ